MSGDERNGEFCAGQTHGEIFYATALGKKFRLSGKPESDFVHPGFVNWPSHDSVEFAASSECHRLFERSGSGASSFRCWLATLTIWLAANDDVVGRIWNAPDRKSGVEGKSVD